MNKKNNEPTVVSDRKFAVMVGIYVLWLAFLTVVAIMRKMGC
jgi:uncharacterized membrane protein